MKEIASRYHASNLRVFGSVARGDNHEDSDIDFLVRFEPGASLLDQSGLIEELGRYFGCRVDVVSDKSVNKYLAFAIERDVQDI